MIAKSPCQQCGVPIEFEADNFEPGIKTPCPACGRETELFLKFEKCEPPKQNQWHAPLVNRALENDLDGIGDNIFAGCWILAAICAVFIVVLLAQQTGSARDLMRMGWLLVTALSLVGTGMILRAVFRWMAEMLRLQRTKK